jgi:hypothetical protein
MTAELLEPEHKMARFAGTFPCLAQEPFVTLWDANGLDAWAAESRLSHGELVTA